MKITKRQLRRIIKEEVITREYEELQDKTDDLFSHEHPEEAVAQEDSWAGGQNIHHQLDHSEASGGDCTTKGVEILKISEAQLRRIVREAVGEDSMGIINQALEDSIPAIGKGSETYEHQGWGGNNPRKEAPRSRTLTYKFMSTYAPHDDDVWNASTTKSRKVVLDNLVKHGATIEGSVPPMDDFGTPAVKFSLGGQPFELHTTGHRYDVEIYARAGATGPRDDSEDISSYVLPDRDTGLTGKGLTQTPSLDEEDEYKW